jgi:hypothetical protein
VAQRSCAGRARARADPAAPHVQAQTRTAPPPLRWRAGPGAGLTRRRPPRRNSSASGAPRVDANGRAAVEPLNLKALAAGGSRSARGGPTYSSGSSMSRASGAASTTASRGTVSRPQGCVRALRIYGPRWWPMHAVKHAAAANTPLVARAAPPRWYAGCLKRQHYLRHAPARLGRHVIAARQQLATARLLWRGHAAIGAVCQRQRVAPAGGARQRAGLPDTQDAAAGSYSRCGCKRQELSLD